MLKFLKKHKAYLLIGYAFLLTIHFVVKDRFYSTGIIFYAVPLTVLIAISFPIAALYFTKKSHRFIAVSSIVFLISYWTYNYTFWHTAEIPENSRSILLYNVADAKYDNIETIKKTAETYNVETVILLEAHYFPEKDTLDFLNILKPLKTKFLFGSAFAASKHQIEHINYVKEITYYRLNHIKIQSKTKPLSIAIVDVYANPIYDRSYSISKILNYAESNDIDIIIGDFNTPFESVHFEDYNTNYQTLRSYQNGITSTWPFGIPLFELDQIWIKKSLTPIQLKKSYHSKSDHAMLLGFFE